MIWIIGKILAGLFMLGCGGFVMFNLFATPTQCGGECDPALPFLFCVAWIIGGVYYILAAFADIGDSRAFKKGKPT